MTEPHLNITGSSGGGQFVSVSDAGPTNDSTNGLLDLVLCSLCRKCLNRRNVEAHMRRHLYGQQVKPVTCQACQYAAYDESDVQRHIHASHFGQSVRIQRAFKMDIEAQVVELVSACKLIGAEDNGFGGGSLAMDQSDDEMSFIRCALCSKSFPNAPYAVLPHMKSHLQFTGYQCSFCDNNNLSVKRFGSISEFRQHLTSVHNRDLAQRQLESVELLWAEQLTNLLEFALWNSTHSKPNLQCALCAEQLDWKWDSLQNHVLMHCSCYAFKCVYCLSPFVSMDELLSHMHEAHADAEMKLNFMPAFAAESKLSIMFVRCFPDLAAESIEKIDVRAQAQAYSGTVATIMPSEPELWVAKSEAPAVQSPELSPVAVQKAPAAAAAAQPQPYHKSSGGGGGAVAAPHSIPCLLCQTMISRNMSCLIAHAKIHLGYKPLK